MHNSYPHIHHNIQFTNTQRQRTYSTYSKSYSTIHRYTITVKMYCIKSSKVLLCQISNCWPALLNLYRTLNWLGWKNFSRSLYGPGRAIRRTEMNVMHWLHLRLNQALINLLMNSWLEYTDAILHIASHVLKWPYYRIGTSCTSIRDNRFHHSQRLRMPEDTGCIPCAQNDLG